MPLIPEFTIAVALGGILILYILFRFLNSSPGYLARKNDILDGFQSLRSRSIKLQETLSGQILSNNFAMKLVEENLTYKDFLKHLQKNHIKNLSDKNYARIKNTHNRVVLMQAEKMLTEQEIILQDAEARLKKAL